jgi:hypothetical protein
MQYEDFNILENTVVYMFEDGTDVIVDRFTPYNNHLLETQDEDMRGFKSQSELKKEEYDFYADFDNVKDYVI